MFRLSRLVHYAISPFSRIRPTLVCVTEKFVAIAAPLEPFASHPFACVLIRLGLLRIRTFNVHLRVENGATLRLIRSPPVSVLV
jgi:hypothetical protein